MIVENEIIMDEHGKGKFTATAQYIGFPERLQKTDLSKVFAFIKKGFPYDEKPSFSL